MIITKTNLISLSRVTVSGHGLGTLLVSASVSCVPTLCIESFLDLSLKIGSVSIWKV